MTEFRLTRIPPPDWATQPALHTRGVTVAEFASIQRHRDTLLRAVQSEAEEYMNTPGLFEEGEGFPDRLRMTGEYYIGAESYLAHRNPGWFQIGVQCRCLARSDAGDGDYLGLEVWLRCLPDRWTSFEVFRNTDSSAI